MRLKRTKDYKRYMNMYCQTFHFRKPYQVLVDADFIQTALDQRMDLRTNIPKVLCDASKQMVTPCTMALLKSRGEDASGAFLASKRFEKRRCKHQEAVDEDICLSQIISTSNPHNYVVASQSKKLRSKFGQVPGVPLLYINRSNLILEPPSEASMNKCKEIESGKTHASTKELATLKTVKVTGQGKVTLDVKAAKKLEEKQESKKQKREVQKAKLLKKPGAATAATEKKKKAEGEGADGASEKKKRKRRKSKSASANQGTAAGDESS
ncbi:hypothetical protein BG015_011519 [Linnemannia schmuckeri]|uniref:U three protein 23 n=1 Tax=Linnemannia schmuckeri TaxID=64567 RepID=A0A9P5V7T6_9FUNG|nr:hypothetical protein BG015_011519 [Linnemannia schmuckeri]